METAALEPNLSFVTYTRDQVVHPVDRAQECGLPAARRADERGDLARWHLHGDLVEGLLFTVPEGESIRYDCVARLRTLLPGADGPLWFQARGAHPKRPVM